jgi:PAS domain S-box-containing protein
MPSDKEQRLPKHAGVSAGSPIESPDNAETVLAGLASAFLGKFEILPGETGGDASGRSVVKGAAEAALPSPEDMYRVLVEQIPAVVFIAYIDRGSSEAYVSPQIESSLGFSQEEWLQDPIRWYERIHPDDKQRWSVDAAQMLVTSEPLKSAYRVIARDGRVVWFQCEVKMVRKPDGRPWFLHGVGFDITDLKQTEQSLQERTVEGGGKDGLAGLHYETEQIVDRCINETRTLSYLLHPPLLDEIGFVAAATWYAEGFAKRSGIIISLQIAPKLGRLPEPVELALFRILQETLTNIHRHSESASAEIEVGLEDNQITMKIRDYGKGMPADILNRFQKTGERAGVGLSGIRERVKELGGRVEIKSDRDGTLLSVVLPLDLKREAEKERN